MPFRVLPSSAPQTCLSCTVKGPHCFCTLTSSALLELQTLGTFVHFDSGQTVLLEEAASDRVFIVCRGRLKLTASSADGKLLIVRVAGPGDVLGLAAMLNGVRHKVTAQTLEPCDLKSISRAAFLSFMETFRDASRNAAASVAWEYEGMLLTARRLATSSSAAGKLATALLDWGRMGLASSPQSEPISFPMPLTHEELGNMTGLSRETVTRLLTRFRKEGLVELKQQRLTLPRPAALESLYC